MKVGDVVVIIQGEYINPILWGRKAVVNKINGPVINISLVESYFYEFDLYEYNLELYKPKPKVKPLPLPG